MSLKYDLEMLMADIKTLLVNNFNTKLTALTAEKGDSLPLPPVATAAIFIQQLNGASINLNPFVLIHVVDVKTEGQGPYTANEYDIDVVLVATDRGEQLDFHNVMFRYQRAMQEVFQEHWTENEQSLKTIVTSLVPRAFQLMNSTHEHRCIGVSLRACIG